MIVRVFVDDSEHIIVCDQPTGGILRGILLALPSICLYPEMAAFANIGPLEIEFDEDKQDVFSRE